jgi:hypothetical protein
MVLDRLSGGGGGGRRCKALGKGDPFWCWLSRSLVDRIFCGEPRPHWTSLSDVRGIMMFMRILMVESLCQAAMGWISALQCLLSDVRGSLWLCLVLSNIKWSCWPRMSASRSLVQNWRLPDDATQGTGCVLSRGKKGTGTGPAWRLALVRHTWIPSHLPLDGTGPYPDLLSHNQRSSIPEIQDPNRPHRTLNREFLGSICWWCEKRMLARMMTVIPLCWVISWPLQHHIRLLFWIGDLVGHAQAM